MAFQTKIRLSDDKVIQIGGVSLTLSGDTKIDNNGTIEYVSNRHGDYVNRSLVDKEYVDNEITGVTGITSTALTGATNGLNNDDDSRVVELGGTITKETDITLSGSGIFRITDNRTTTEGMLYNADYSDDFVARSLVDAGYVTGLTSGITEDIEEITGITSIAITGVSNGLTKSGSHDAILGGTLTGNTTFTGTGSNYHLLYAADYSTAFTARSIPDAEYVTGITSDIVTNFETFTGNTQPIIDAAITGVTNGLTKNGDHDVVLGGTLTGDTIFTGTGSNYHLQYAADYSSQFSALSIPHIGYVTGITSTIEEVTDFALTGATNGLSVSGRNAVLGGNLTGNTQISGASNNLSIIDIGTFTLYGFGAGRNITLETDGGQLLLDASNASLRNCNAGSFVINNTTGAVYTDEGSPTFNGGIKYDACYHDTYTLRSLTDVEYVTGLTSGITEDIEEITGITSIAITGVSNGLTKCGSHDAVLGGTLTEPTTLSGSQIFGINVNQINLTGSTTNCGINLGGTVSLKTDPAGTGGLLCRDATTGEICQTSLSAFGGITGATNGLSNCGNQQIGLGGTLCAITTISGADFNLNLGENASKLGDFNVCAANTKIGTGTFNVCSSGMTFTDLSAVQEGITYAADYSTTFVDRSLVDKGYVDAVATGLQPHEAVLVATTGNTTLSGIQTIDGIALSNGDRVLVKNQTTASQNGIYIASSSTWTRAEDFNDDPLTIEVKSGDLVPVLSGSTQAATIWILTTPDPITIDTTPLTFTLFSRSLSYVGGDGISITQGTGLNQTIDVDLATNSGLCFNSNQLSVASSIAGTGLSWSGGTINANVATGGETEISVRVDGSNNLVVNAADIDAALGGVITGATNGLNTNTNPSIVELGGALTKATTICGTDTNSLTYQDNAVTNQRGILYAADYSDTYVARSLVDAAYVTGITSDITTNFETFTGNTQPIIDASITGVTNGLTKNGSHDAVLGGTLTGNTVFTGTGSNYHLQYAADYSTAFTARSIPDAAWVTGQTTTAGIQDAENGLTKTGTTVVLGGTLTGDTVIDGNGTVGILTINDIDSITISSIGAVNDSGGYINLSGTGAIIEGNNNVTTGARLQVNTDNSLVLTTYNAGTFSGATYGGDYEANFVARTLVTAQYVTGITSGIIEDVEEISGVTSVALTGATNGLTKSGRNATLGGALTGNTIISGASTYSLGLGASGSLLTALNVHATSSNLNSTLNVSGATVLGSTLNVSGNTIIDGTVTLNNVAAGTASNDVLLIDSNNVVKQIPASEFGNITGATNGLSIDNRNVVLGGTLTGNTEISGATNNLSISNLGQLNLSSTNGSSFTLDGLGGASIISGGAENITLTSADEINATAGSVVNLTAGDNNNINLFATGGISGNINLSANTSINLDVVTTNINSTNFNVTGTTNLNTVASGDSTQDSVLVRTSAGEVRQIPATDLGEDNNNYDILIISSNTTLDETNYTVLVNSSGSSITVTLPASPIDGQAYKIKDYAGDALTNNIIINGNGKPIDGGGATINTDYGALEIVFSTDTIVGGGWYVMSFVN